MRAIEARAALGAEPACRARCRRLCDDDGGEESASSRTRTQPLVRRPDRLRHSGLPQGCEERNGVRHTARESLDFTPTGTRAERVHMVNGCGKRCASRDSRRGMHGTAIGQCEPLLFQVFGPLGHVFDIDAAERCRETAFGFGQRRPHHSLTSADAGTGGSSASSALEAARRISSAVMSLVFAREFVAAVRPANAFQNAIAHKRLQHRFEMARRKLMTRGKRLGRHRPASRIDGHVDHSGNGKNAFARNQRHYRHQSQLI